MKCLEKEPRRRYAGAGELAADLRRFLAGEPIIAHRIGWKGRVIKWCRREPAKASLAGAAVSAIAGGFVGMAILWRMAEARAAAEKLALDRTVAAEHETRNQLYLSQIAAAQLEWRLGNVANALAILDKCESDRRGWEWRYLWNLNHADLLTTARPVCPMSWA